MCGCASAAQKLGGLSAAGVGKMSARSAAYFAFHSTRLFGYLGALPPLLFMAPRSTLLSLAAYAVVHRAAWWQRGVHRVFGYGASRRHRIVNEVQHLYPADKRYLVALHPHGILCDAWHSIIARHEDSFAEDGPGLPAVGRGVALCVSPVIPHRPAHQEMFRNRCSSAAAPSVLRWWDLPGGPDPAVCPGGIPESVFASSEDPGREYAYLKGRKGFLRLCIERGHDVMPIYSFGVTRMYRNPTILRGARARLSQKLGFGLVVPWGRWGTSMPLTDETTTVVFPPFEASMYSLNRIDEAHADYLRHLKLHFDGNKAKYGMAAVELVFVGPDYEDRDCVAAWLCRVGLARAKATRASKL